MTPQQMATLANWGQATNGPNAKSPKQPFDVICRDVSSTTIPASLSSQVHNLMLDSEW